MTDTTEGRQGSGGRERERGMTCRKGQSPCTIYFTVSSLITVSTCAAVDSGSPPQTLPTMTQQNIKKEQNAEEKNKCARVR